MLITGVYWILNPNLNTIASVPSDIIGYISGVQKKNKNLNFTNGVFFSTKNCALYFKKCNFVFVS